ncbi:MAG TPA: 50S ribosomal protein L21 [Mycobacteriales bacterium]|nr:50S ribosomal protein L21 [Mycobacteriales bacterium]
MYAIVRAGGHQHKVAVGDTLTVDRLSAGPGDTVTLPALLLVDGERVTSDAAALAKTSVTAEIVEHGKGPKIIIHKFRNKTGYHKRQGHRQQLTTLKVTGIDAGQK